MFTGIIEETGQIKSLTRQSGSLRITVGASRVLEDLKIGDSISLNGTCQTVIKTDKDQFVVEAVSETLKRTTFEKLKVNQWVNLERATKLSDRLGGHILTGHVDCKGKVHSIKNEDGSLLFEISLSPDKVDYLVEKGSIAVDGISLTVVQVKPESFTVSMIPHTLKTTNFVSKKAGDEVNIELDIVAKYIDKMLTSKSRHGRITKQRLEELGW